MFLRFIHRTATSPEGRSPSRVFVTMVVVIDASTTLVALKKKTILAFIDFTGVE